MRPSPQISDAAEVDLKTGSLEVIAIGQARAEKRVNWILQNEEGGEA